MDDSIDRLTNLVGALALAVDDSVRDAAEAATGLGAAAPAALVSLHEFLDHGSIERLSGAVGLSHSGAVRLVDRLAQGGFVERHGGANGREVAITLTERGHLAARAVLAARAAAVRGLVEELSLAEQRSLVVISEKLLAAITRQRLEARAEGHVPAGGWLCRLCDSSDCGRAEGACPTATTASSGGKVGG
jgi:DNA-binding MarR family transcriptional regulator